MVRPSVDSKADMSSATGPVMSGLTRHPVLSMAESEQEGSSMAEENVKIIQSAAGLVAEVFPDSEIVYALSTQLSWTHILALLPLKCAVYSDGERGQYGRLEHFTMLCSPSTSGALRLTLRTNGLPFVLSVAERSRSRDAGSRPA